MARRKPIRYSVNKVDFNDKEWPYKYIECTTLEAAKLAFMDWLLEANETVAVEKMDNSDCSAQIVERVTVKGETTNLILAIQAIGI